MDRLVREDFLRYLASEGWYMRDLKVGEAVSAKVPRWG